MRLTTPTDPKGITVSDEMAQEILNLLIEAKSTGEFERGRVLRRVGFDTPDGELGGLLRVSDDTFELFVGPQYAKYEGRLRDLRVQLGQEAA